MKNTFIKEFRVNKGSSTEPTRTRPYIKFICFHCNTIQTMSKASYKETKPCKECDKRLRGKVNFLKKAQEKFGDAFDLSKASTSYFDYFTPVPITCNKHNFEYNIKPVHFVSNSYDNQPHKGGCPKCAQDNNKLKNLKSSDSYLQLLEDKFPDITLVNFPIGIVPSDAEFTATCTHHGNYTKKLRDILKINSEVSNMCPTCSKEYLAWNVRYARNDIPGIVYFVHFKDVNLYKCGVTYKTTKERLKKHINNIDIVWELPFDTLSNAYFFETQFFRKYFSYKCNHPNLKFGGYTEFLSIDIPKPSERFIEEILCRKESNSEELPPSIDEDNSERSL